MAASDAADLARHLESLEKRVAAIFGQLSGQTEPITNEFSVADADLPPRLEGDPLQAELALRKLAGLQVSLSNLSEVLGSADGPDGIGDVRWTAECTYVYCCKWGPPPGGQGTAVCLEQCCGGYANRLEPA
jgi:hypothetical protein